MSRQNEERQPLPVTIRFPAIGKREFYTGLTRNALYRMWRDGLLQTALIKPGGQGRGYRLIFLRPLLDYMAERRKFEPVESPELPENLSIEKSRKSS